MRMSRHLGAAHGLRGPYYINPNIYNTYRYCIYEAQDGSTQSTNEWIQVNQDENYLGKKVHVDGGTSPNYDGVYGGSEIDYAYIPFKIPNDVRIKKISIEITFFGGGGDNSTYFHYGWALCTNTNNAGSYVSESPSETSSEIKGLRGSSGFNELQDITQTIISNYTFEEAQQFSKGYLYLFLWPAAPLDSSNPYSRVTHIKSATLTYYYY